ncbi:MAG: hypothetical protein AAGC79_11040 [Pseudomonadota bacterium]
MQLNWIPKAFLLALLTYPQTLSANGFTSAEVLGWQPKSQETLFQDSISMIAIVAGQTGDHGHIAKCIGDWYAEGAAGTTERNTQIRDAMWRFPDSHPQAVILAVVQKRCGSF